MHLQLIVNYLEKFFLLPYDQCFKTQTATFLHAFNAELHHRSNLSQTFNAGKPLYLDVDGNSFLKLLVSFNHINPSKYRALDTTTGLVVRTRSFKDITIPCHHLNLVHTVFHLHSSVQMVLCPTHQPINKYNRNCNISFTLPVQS